MKVVSMVETAPLAAAPAVPAVVTTAPAAGLNSVQVVTQQAYTFNPERFSEVTDGDTVIPVQNRDCGRGLGWSRLVTTVQVWLVVP